MPRLFIFESFITVFGRTAIKQITLGVVMLLAFSFSVIADAELVSSVSSVVSDDGKIVVAVRPYFTKEDKVRIDCKDRYLIPVAVLIQNYRNKIVQVLSPKVAGSKRSDGEVWFSPYTKHGQIESWAFSHDMNVINKQLHDQYRSRSDLLPLKTNGTLHNQDVLPESAISGLVYLDPRDKKYRQIKVDSLTGLALAIKFKATSQNDWSVAKLSLASPNRVSIEKSAPPNYIGGLYYAGQSQSRKKNEKFNLIKKTYSDCFIKSVNSHANDARFDLGVEAMIILALNSNGEYLGRNTLYMGANGAVKLKTAAILEEIRKCSTPNVKHDGEGENGKPYFVYIGFVGDYAVTPMFADLVWLYSLLGKTIVSHVSEKDVNACSEWKWPTIRIKIDSNGNILNMDGVKKGDCYDGVRSALLEVRSIPQPLNPILDEELRKGMLININTVLNLEKFYFDRNVSGEQ